MNDVELDQLLDTWIAPAPSPSLRHDLRARFPRTQPRRYVRPLRWALLIALSFILAVALAQSSENRWDVPVVRALNQMYQKFIEAQDARRSSAIAREIRDSEPRTYVDGQLVEPPEYFASARLDVRVPGEGMYSITSFRFTPLKNAAGRPTGWVEGGRIHGNAIEFQAGSKHVLIECNKQIVDSDRPVFIRPWQ